MIYSLFKYNFKTNRILLLSLAMVMFFYYSIIMMMFDPNNIQALNNMLELLPKEMIDALGFSNFGSTLLTFIVGYIYGFLIYLFPMVVIIVINHKLVASLVDKGSIAAILASPHSRFKIILTQLISSVFLTTLFFTITTVMSSVAAELMFPGVMEYGIYIKVNIYATILYYAIGSIVFFGSCIANDAKTSLSIGVGVPVAFLVIQMASNVGSKLNWLANFTMFSLFDAELMIAGDPFATTGMFALFAIAVILYSASVFIFNKKNLYV